MPPCTYLPAGGWLLSRQNVLREWRRLQLVLIKRQVFYHHRIGACACELYVWMCTARWQHGRCKLGPERFRNRPKTCKELSCIRSYYNCEVKNPVLTQWKSFLISSRHIDHLSTIVPNTRMPVVIAHRYSIYHIRIRRYHPAFQTSTNANNLVILAKLVHLVQRWRRRIGSNFFKVDYHTILNLQLTTLLIHRKALRGRAERFTFCTKLSMHWLSMRCDVMQYERPPVTSHIASIGLPSLGTRPVSRSTAGVPLENYILEVVLIKRYLMSYNLH